MDNNNICSIQGAPFNSMPRLRVLSLRNNRMTTLRERAFQRLRGSAALLDVAGNPLACSCSLAWLQAWLHELEPRGHRTGRQLDDSSPRCADGSPLREQRLSRLDCPEGRAVAETPHPPAEGCEADVAAPLLGTSQVLSTWMEVKESTPSPQGVLSPEDSDYFYDEYVEYQYDENATVPSNNTNSNIISATTLSSLVPVVQQQQADSAPYPSSTLSPHYIAGDTPTLYAGTRREPNKTQQVPPLQIPQPSPPTSGLTFFGIPLPSINLGSLWGSARKSDPKHSDVKFFGNRGKVEMLQPSPVPPLQSGFIPMLPESGGFMPIVNPLLAQRNDHKAHGSHVNAQQQLKVNYSLWERPGNNKTLQLTDSTNISSYDDEQSILSHRGPGLLPIPPPLPEGKELIPAAGTAFPRTIGGQGHTNMPEAQQHANFLNPLALHTSPSQTTQNPPSQPIPLSHRGISSNAATVLGDELQRVPVSTMIPPPKLQVDGATTENKRDHTQHAESIEYEQTTLPPTTLGSGWGFHWRGKSPTAPSDFVKTTTGASSDITTLPPVTGSVLGLISAQSEGFGQNVASPSSLSALLVPGGQQPQFRSPAGKPTITKVTVSPGTSPSTPDPEPVEEYLIGPEPKANSHSTESLSSSKAESSVNSSMEWYFKNYNRTNLEPYIGPGRKVITGQASRICASLSIFVFVLTTQWL